MLVVTVGTSRSRSTRSVGRPSPICRAETAKLCSAPLSWCGVWHQLGQRRGRLSAAPPPARGVVDGRPSGQPAAGHPRHVRRPARRLVLTSLRAGGRTDRRLTTTLPDWFLVPSLVAVAAGVGRTARHHRQIDAVGLAPRWRCGDRRGDHDRRPIYIVWFAGDFLTPFFAFLSPSPCPLRLGAGCSSHPAAAPQRLRRRRPRLERTLRVGQRGADGGGHARRLGTRREHSRRRLPSRGVRLRVAGIPAFEPLGLGPKLDGPYANLGVVVALVSVPDVPSPRPKRGPAAGGGTGWAGRSDDCRRRRAAAPVFAVYDADEAESGASSCTNAAPARRRERPMDGPLGAALGRRIGSAFVAASARRCVGRPI